MNPLEERLREHGFDDTDITFVAELLEKHTQDLAIGQATQLVHNVFLRVEKDSVAGCALRRALGFSGGESLARAARAFGVSKQYLHDVQDLLVSQLGELRLGSVVTRDPAAGRAGPSPDDTLNR